MKNAAFKFLLMMVVGLIAGSPGPVKADGGSFLVNGRWAGIAIANTAFDLDHDGNPARTFDVKTYDQLPFAGLEGVIDAALVSIGVCAPGALELKPSGLFTFRGRNGDGLYAEIDPAGPNLCFNPSNPSEVATIRLVGGTGIYQHAAGTGTLTLHDNAKISNPVGSPLLIDTRGEFSLSVHL